MEFTHRQLKPNRSVGEILKHARKKKNLSLEQAEEETKVRAKYLEALEQSHFEALPASVYAAGFLAKYADFLNLNKEEIIQQFNLERGQDKFASKLMVERKLREPRFSVTPKVLVISGIILVLAGIIGYIVYNVHQFASPPNLEISSPSTEQILKEDNVEIVGKTDSGTTLYINNQTILTDDNGNFHQKVNLTPGLNSFEIRAVNGLKKENIKIIKVLAEY